MNSAPLDFSPLSVEQVAALGDEHKAVFQLLTAKDRSFFAQTFSEKDLPAALERKAEIMKRNQTQRQKIGEVMASLAQVQTEADFPAAGGMRLGEIAAGAAAAVGIGAVAASVSTDGNATWKGVPPRLLANALEQAFDNGETTDVEVEGSEDNLLATVFLRPPDGSRYVPAITVSLHRVEEIIQVKVGDLTSETFLEAAKHGGQRLLELAGKGLNLWLRRRGVFSAEAVDLAQSALNSAFDAAQVARDLNLKDRVWQVIKETADAREKAWQIEAERERQLRQDLIDAWEAYNKCPRCGEPFRQQEDVCHICGRGRNVAPTQPDPRAL